MAVLFVVYIPNEELQLSTKEENDEADAATSSAAAEQKLFDVGAAGGGTGPKLADNDSADEYTGDGDDDAVLERLINSGKSGTSCSADQTNELKKSNSFCVVGSSERRTTSAAVGTIDSKLAPAESKQSVFYKGEKVRFHVTTLPRDNLQTDGSKSVMASQDLVENYTPGDNVPDGSIENSADMVMERFTLKEALYEILDTLNIDNEVWELTENGNFWHLQFIVESERSEQVLKRLVGFGFGRIPETSVSVFSSNVHFKQDDETLLQNQRRKKSERSEFVKSIKSRLTVAQVVMAVQSNAILTFDYLVLIGLASIIAGLGLAESSSVVLVASMLISPLMGPIVGFTFGVVIKNVALYKLAVRNELIGLSICLVLGFLFGLITGGVNNTGAYWGSSDSWPTQEMQTRGMLRSLWVGVLIALPSGAGVALSILGGNTGSLVGVAISASLLPPAVNAGMLWGLALVSAGSHPPTEASAYDNGAQLNCASLVNNNYKFVYSCDMSTEAAILGAVSLLLTILNIICIFVAGIGVLKIKEIAPHTAINEQAERFWKKEIPVMRHTYKTIKGSASLDFRNLAKKLIADNQSSELPQPSEDTIENIVDMAETDQAFMDFPVPNHNGPAETQLLRQLSRDFSSSHPPAAVTPSSGNTVEPLHKPTIVDNHYFTVTDRRYIERCSSLLAATPQSPVIATPQNGGAGPTGSVLRFRQRNASVSSASENMVLIDLDLIAAHQKQTHNRRSIRHTGHIDHTSPSTKHDAPLIEISEVPHI
jgi:uncharacterized hydrophobic protein (TIGR00271 family)